MASKSDSLVPILLLAGLAAFLLYSRTQTATTKAATAARSQSNADKITAVGNAVKGFIDYLGGATASDGNYSSAKPTQAALDQIIQAGKDWTAAYGAATDSGGDPLNPQG